MPRPQFRLSTLLWITLAVACWFGGREYEHRHTQTEDSFVGLGIELKVAFNLDPEGRFKMQGYIDRLGRDSEGTLWIHDYKTSSRKLSEEDAKTEDQLALYQIGLSQNPHYGPKEKVKLIWHFVAFEKDQVVAERNPKEINWLKEKYISKIETIEKAKTYPTKTGVLCQWCEFLSVCSDGQKWVENKKKNAEAKAEAGKLAKEKTAPALEAAPAPADSPASPAVAVETPKAGLNPSAFSPLPQGESRSGRKKRSLASVSPDQLPLF